MERHRRLSLADAQRLTLVIQDIGRERLQAEYGSDAMSATIAQTASVLGNLLAGDQVGVSFVRRPLKVVRYGLRALSLSMTSAIAQTRTSTAFRNLLLAAVGVCVALVVLGVHLPTPLSASAVVAAGLWLVLTVNGYVTQLFIAVATVATVLVMLGSDTAPRVFSGESGDTTRWTVAIAAVALFGVAALVEMIRQWLSNIPEQSTSDRFRRVVVAVLLVAGAGYLIASPLRRGPWTGGLSGHISLIVWVALASHRTVVLAQGCPKDRRPTTPRAEAVTRWTFDRHRGVCALGVLADPLDHSRRISIGVRTWWLGQPARTVHRCRRPRARCPMAARSGNTGVDSRGRPVGRLGQARSPQPPAFRSRGRRTARPLGRREQRP